MRRHQIIPLLGFVTPVVIVSVLIAGGVEESRSVSSRHVTSTETANTNYSASTRITRDRAVDALDRIRDKVEQWGVVTISAPIAVLDESAFYVPDNIVSPEDAYKSAQSEVQASAVQATEVGISNQFGATVVPGVPTIIPPVPKPPKGGTATQTTNSTTTVTSPAGATATPPPDANGPELLPSQAPTPAGTITPLNLGAMPAPTKSVAAALREAQDNAMRQNLYTQMSFPKEIKGADGQYHNHVIFVIVQVSCNPGWRTKEHYIADCSASLEYSKLDQNKHAYDPDEEKYISRAERRTPTVFSVLPLIDAQTVEMANSQRDVTQLAFQLAASLPVHGVNIKAKDLFQFVRRYSRDLRSRTPIPVINSYSSGGTFGFRFSPSFQAMRDPAQKNARAANVLLPTSFPALITVVIHQSDLDFIKRNYDWPESAILTHVSTRWVLKDRPPLWQLPKRLFAPMRRDTAEMEINAADDVRTVYNAKYEFGTATMRSNGDDFNPMYEEMRREIIALEEKGVGRDWPIPISDKIFDPQAKADQEAKDELMRAKYEVQKGKTFKKGPSIDRITPADVPLDAAGGAFDLVVFGTRLDGVKSANLGDVKTTDIKAIGESLTISFKFKSAKDGDNPDLALLDAKDGEVATKKKAITIHVKKKDKPADAEDSSSSDPATEETPNKKGQKAATSKPTPMPTPPTTASPTPTAIPAATPSPKSEVKKSP